MKLYDPIDDKKRIIVTGAAGLIGYNLSKYLCQQGYRVYGIDNFSGGANNFSHLNFQMLTCEVESNDFSSLFRLIDPHVVYHCAAYAAEGLSPFIRKFNYTNNLVATANVINNCIEGECNPKLIFFSSMAVYGNVHTPPFAEDLQPNPIDPYGIAKYACEMDIRVAGEQHGLDWVIIRPHNFFGRGQNIWDKYRNVIGIWMRQYLENNPLTIFGDGTQLRAFSPVMDALEPLHQAMLQPKAKQQIINLGGTKFVSIRRAAEVLVEIMGGGEIVHVQNRHEVHSAYSSWAKSVELLGFEDKTSLIDGIKDMWEWVQTHPDPSPSRHWGKCEISKGLYDFWKIESK